MASVNGCHEIVAKLRCCHQNTPQSVKTKLEEICYRGFFFHLLSISWRMRAFSLGLFLFLLFCNRRWECTVIHGKHLAFKRECSHWERRRRRRRRRKKHIQKANANDTLGSREPRSWAEARSKKEKLGAERSRTLMLKVAWILGTALIRNHSVERSPVLKPSVPQFVSQI